MAKQPQSDIALALTIIAENQRALVNIIDRSLTWAGVTRIDCAGTCQPPRGIVMDRPAASDAEQLQMQLEGIRIERDKAREQTAEAVRQRQPDKESKQPVTGDAINSAFDSVKAANLDLVED